MLDTFDPSAFSSPSECVRELKELGISLGHRLGARVFGLGHRGVRFSLAFLEEAAEGGAARELLERSEWTVLASTGLQEVGHLLDPEVARAVEEGGVLHVVTPDEVLPETALVPSSGASTSLLPSVTGAEAGVFGGALWDRRRLEQASLSLLDAEDPEELVESFRYLFRALVTSGQNPTGLLVTALRRKKRELSREVAAQVREHLSRDLGRALLDLLSEDPRQMAGALKYLLGEAAASWRELLPVVLVPALQGALERGEGRAVVLSHPEPLARRLGGELERIETFLDALLDRIPELGFKERVNLGTFLVSLAANTAGLSTFLLRRAEVAADPHMQAFLGSVLSRVEQDPQERERCVDLMVELFLTRGHETALQERLRPTFMQLGTAPLERLARPEALERLEPGQRIWLIHLWNQYRAEKLELPDDEIFVGLARSEILGRRRGSMLALVRSGQLCHPSLVEALTGDPERELLIGYLLAEASRMEEPDDEAVFDLLAHFGPEVLSPAFRRLREEAALQSAAAAHRLFFFGRLASRLEEPGDLSGMASEILGFPIYRAEAHPRIWLGLGSLGSVPGLGAEHVSRIIALLMEDLDVYPEARVEALLLAYPRADEELRREVEERLRSVLEAESPDRHLLKACLDGLERLLERGDYLVEPERLVADLCRTVLMRSRTPDLQHVMRRALSYASEGDGVQQPTAWAKEDRDQALRILGAVACHPATPDRLHRMVLVRLFSFLTDWLEAVEQGTDLYTHRDTPLWELLDRVLRTRPGEVGFQLAGEIGLKVLELHQRSPRNLALEWRERTQRFLVTLIEHDVGPQLAHRGVPIDLPASLLRVLMELEPVEDQDRPVSLYLLSELSGRTLRPDLRPRLDAYLTRAQ